MTEDLTRWVDEGRKAARRTEESAAEAASYCFLVFRASHGPDAGQQARRDLADAIARANQTLEEENGKFVKLRGLGKRLKLGWKIDNDDFESLPDDHPEKKLARELFELEINTFKKRLYVVVSYDETNEDGVLTAVVRHTTGFFRSYERASVTRYKRATEWLRDEFAGVPADELTHEKLCHTIAEAGGFAQVVQRQIAKSKSESGDSGQKASRSAPKTAGQHSDADDQGFKRTSFAITVLLKDGVELVDGEVKIEGAYVAATTTLTVTSCSLASKVDQTTLTVTPGAALQPDQGDVAAKDRQPEPAL